MPPALLRACSGGCGALVEKSPCSNCARAREQSRGTRTARGYGVAWQSFRRWFKKELLRHDIAPVCGAALPGGPSMAASQCKAAGRLVDRSADGSDLHVDHDPPLRDEERSDRRAVCDALRVGLLCQACHAAKTRQEQGT